MNECIEAQFFYSRCTSYYFTYSARHD